MDPRRTVSPETALASDIFDRFCSANTLKSILIQYRHLCSALRLKPTHFPDFYPRLRAKLPSWRAQALWSKFEKRASHKLYNRGKACYGSRVLIIGAGPCGLRTAIEAQLLGAKVVVIEKRDRFSRNNVLHLWPFVIADLKALGAKKFYGKFCAGSIDHISIRQIQCILLKVALLLGVEVHEGVGFEGLLEPTENEGWRAIVSPSDHPVSHYNFDVLIGADGRRNTLDGFKRKALRAKLAIAITANFINKHSEAEARVKEISGVSYIFNQKFFQELNEATGIDLENIVYYKDETHYFVMTAKKQSLLNKGVLLEDHADTAKLLSHENISSEALMTYAFEAAIFSTDNQLPNLDFAVNHYGQPDVAMFDFTAMYAAENACRVVQQKGHKLLMTLVGDSLLEPFWPTGSGCARGFLSSFDACWMLKSWASGSKSVLEVIAERESIYRLLGQTTPENLNKEHLNYTLDPSSRYPNLNTRAVMPFQVKSLYDTDDMTEAELSADGRCEQLLMDPEKVAKKRRRDSVIAVDSLLSWLRDQVAGYGLDVSDVCDAFNRGDVLCAIINRFRPDLIEFPLPSEENVDPLDIAACRNQIAFDILQEEFGLNPVMSGFESIQCTSSDFLAVIAYLSQIYEIFRGEIPQIKYPRVESCTDVEEYEQQQQQQQQRSSHSHSKQHSSKPALVVKHVSGKSLTRRSRLSGAGREGRADGDSESSRKHKKRRSDERSRVSLEERDLRRQEIERNKAERQRRRMEERVLETERFIKSMRLLQLNDRSGEISVTPVEGNQFEDYTFHLYRQMAPNFEERVKYLEKKLFYTGREVKAHGSNGQEPDKQNVSGLAKNLEEKLKGTKYVEKKPKDLNRAIGKIEKSDWNVQLIEKKIEESKTNLPTKKDRIDKVPKWSREAFDDKREAMKRKMEGAGTTGPDKSADRLQQFDENIKKLGTKLRDGNVLEVGQRGANKVSQMAEQLVNKLEKPKEEACPAKPPSQKPIFEFPKRGGSELCHFCNERVYVVERMSAQGKYFHRNCFRCQYCNTSLRLSNYVFDREGRYGERFYCAPHYAMVRVYGWKKYDDQESASNVPCPDGYEPDGPPKAFAEKKQILMDMDERGTTPERVEFENSVDFASEEELLSEMDEEEWTDRNGFSNADNNTSDEASDLSEDDDDITPEGDKAEQNNSFSGERGYHGDAAQCNNKGTESSDSDTEVASGEESLNEEEEEDEDDDDDEEGSVEEEEEEEEEGDEEEDEDEDEDDCEGSTTEIETDSEFAEDPPHSVPGKIPTIVVDEPEQLVTRIIEPTPLSHTQSPSNKRYSGKENNHHHHRHNRHHNQHQLATKKAEDLVQIDVLKNHMVEPVKKNIPERVLPRVTAVPKKWEPLATNQEHHLASKTLELKQKYLQGSGHSFLNSGAKKSMDSAAQSQFRSVLDMISEQQKLLQPAPKPSATMMAVLEGAEKLKMKPTVSPLSGSVPSMNFIGLGFTSGSISPINNTSASNWSSKEVGSNEVVAEGKKEPENSVGDNLINMNIINLEKNKERGTVDEGEKEKGDSEKEVKAGENLDSKEVTNDEKLNNDLIVMTTSTDTATSQSETDTTIIGIGTTREAEDETGEDAVTPRQEISSFPEPPSSHTVDEQHLSDSNDGEESVTESADQLSDSDDIDADIEDDVKHVRHEPPRVEIEDEFGVSLNIDDNYVPNTPTEVKSVLPNNDDIAQKYDDNNSIADDGAGKSLGMSSSDSKDSLNSGMFLETEMSDWARDGDGFEEKRGNRRATKTKKKKNTGSTNSAALGKYNDEESAKYNKLKASLTLDLANFDFADVDGLSSPEDAVYDKKKQGYCKLANEEIDSELEAEVCENNSTRSSRESTPTVESEGQEEKQIKLENTNNIVEAVNPLILKAETAGLGSEKLSSNREDKFAVLDRVVPFSNARDSLDYRKMKNSSSSPLKSKDLYSSYARASGTVSSNEMEEESFKNDEKDRQEEANNAQSSSPGTARRLEEINKERAKQSDLIRSMVMGRIWKSPEKNSRRSSRGSTSPLTASSSSTSGSSDLLQQKCEDDSSARSSQHSIVSSNKPEEISDRNDGKRLQRDQNSSGDDDGSSIQSASSKEAQPLSLKLEPTSLSKIPASSHHHYEPVFTSSPRFRNRPKFDSPFSIYTSVTNPPTPVNPPAFTPVTPELSTPSSFSEGHEKGDEKRHRNASPSFYRSMPDLTACLTPLSTPTSTNGGFATPNVKRWEAYKSASLVDREKARQAARERARLKSDQELGLEETDYVIYKDKLRRKISVPEDEVFDPNAAVVVTSIHPARGDTDKRPEPPHGSNSSGVASSIRANVDFPVAKTNPFVIDTESSPLRRESYPCGEKKESPGTPGRRSIETDDFVHLQLRLSSSTSERKTSPEKAKSMGLWENTPDSFPNYFMPSQPPSFSSVSSGGDSNWILEKSDGHHRPRSNTLSDSSNVQSQSMQGNSHLRSALASAALVKASSSLSPTQAKQEQQHQSAAMSLPSMSAKAKALSSDTLLDDSPLSHPAGLEPTNRGTSVPDFTSAQSSPSVDMRKNKKPKDRERRRSIIQAVSDFFSSSRVNSNTTTNSNSSSGNSGDGSPNLNNHKNTSSPSSSISNSIMGTEQDKSINGSSPSNKDKFSLFKLTPKLLHKDRRASKSRETLVSPLSSPASDPIVPPAKPPRTGLATSAAYWSQPDMVIQRLSASPTPFKSSRSPRYDTVEPNRRHSTPPPSNLRSNAFITNEESPRIKEIREMAKQLEKLEADQRKLEVRGFAIEKSLKGEEKDDLGRGVAEIMEEWFTLVREKTRLARRERELRMKVQKLKLDDRQTQVQERLDQSFSLSDIQKTPDQKAYEIDLINELHSLEKQRGDLLTRYHEEVQKYELQDLELEAKISASSIAPRESNV